MGIQDKDKNKERLLMKKNYKFILLVLTVLYSCKTMGPISNHNLVDRIVKSPDSLMIFLRDTSLTQTKHIYYNEILDSTQFNLNLKAIKLFSKEGYILHFEGYNKLENIQNKFGFGILEHVIIIRSKISRKYLVFKFTLFENGVWKLISISRYYKEDEFFRQF
jgi:hypothetical protein